MEYDTKTFTARAAGYCAEWYAKDATTYAYISGLQKSATKAGLVHTYFFLVTCHMVTWVCLDACIHSMSVTSIA